MRERGLQFLHGLLEDLRLQRQNNKHTSIRGIMRTTEKNLPTENSQTHAVSWRCPHEREAVTARVSSRVILRASAWLAGTCAWVCIQTCV